MKKNIEVNKLVRGHIQLLKPYASARDEYEGSEGIFLDANENALGSVAEGSFNRYPDPLQRRLKEALAANKGIDAAQIFLGNGSDEAIDLLFRIFCEPGRDHVILLPPTYGMYKVSADINRIETQEVPLTDDFQLDTAEIMAALRPGTKMIFICSPNNPSGNLIKRKSIERILEKAPGLVVVDEAYVDFAPESSLLPLLHEYQNLIILQTFSKAWGMARLRLGMAFAHPEIIQLFNKVKPPYNVNGLTQEKALEALGQSQKKEDMVSRLLSNKAKLIQELKDFSLVEKIYPSDANFILVKVLQADELYRRLIKEKVIVRNRSRITLCDNCLRITVGTEGENEALVQTLKSLQIA